ncbi:DUF6382 domain-containing protein [Paenibacillus xylaniclasticus]|uniref:DUF6382 domain-containing protein n=1 Tax=Paenibacillus xylaniclasticus TaxID=588083 RepID=UPI000FDBEB2B|nr:MULTISPECIES: DUF6382 domain-containing protein [Paenibacillus]GFN32088.1 hypothetical protein PCURB6_23480 [Paenibacillus curdlanolyticus]
MEPYRIDFGMMRGHELILDREQPITREELDAMELQMLRSNSIPFLLPVEWIDIDGNVTFRYAIEGRRMLSHQLQLHELTMQDLYICLLAIADALDACKSYLLRPECCLLKENCLFIGDRWDEVYLLYVPLLKPHEEYRKAVDGASEITSLVIKLSTHVKDLDGVGLQMILKQLLDSNGSVRPALRKVLLELLGGCSGHPAPALQEQKGLQAVLNEQKHDNGLGYEHVHAESFRRTNSNPIQQQLSPSQSSQLSRQINERKASLQTGESLRRSADHNLLTESAAVEEQLDSAPVIDLSGDKQPVNAERYKWIASAAAAIAAALVWRYAYLSKLSDDRLLISLGATIIIIATAYMVGWRSRRRVIMSAGSSLKVDSAYDSDNVDQPLQWSLESRLLERRAESVPIKAEKRSRTVHSSAVDYPVKNGGLGWNSKTEQAPASIIRTTLEESTPASIHVSEATVWMGHHSNNPTGDRDEGEEQCYWQLERTVQGGTEPLKLSLSGSTSFLIGRTGGKVHYADEHPGVSRIHLEFGSSEEGISVKDLGSRNGTTLNGMPMIAYKIYKLQNEDALQLAGNEGPVYTLRHVKGAAGL